MGIRQSNACNCVLFNEREIDLAGNLDSYPMINGRNMDADAKSAESNAVDGGLSESSEDLQNSLHETKKHMTKRPLTLTYPEFISDLRHKTITFNVTFEFSNDPDSLGGAKFSKIPSTTFFIDPFLSDDHLYENIQEFFESHFETNEFKIEILDPDFSSLPHVLCLKYPLHTDLHIIYSVGQNRKIHKRELPMQSIDFSNLDFFDDKERPMELVWAIMKERDLDTRIVDIILSYSHSCEICLVIQPALLGECGGCCNKFHVCHVCNTVICTSCHRFGDCCHNCRNYRCYLCSIKEGLDFKKCFFCSASMADFSKVFDNLSETSDCSSDAESNSLDTVGGATLSFDTSVDHSTMQGLSIQAEE